MSTLLQLCALTQRFGGFTAVDGLDLSVESGAIAAVIGPNGAGKSTVFNAITGVYKPVSGSIAFDGTRIDGMPTHKIAALGIARTFQNLRLFAALDAFENVLIGAHSQLRSGLAASMLHTPAQRKEEAAIRERAAELLRFVGLDPSNRQFARNLPYGAQRRLEIARALASQPKLLLLDEPAAGMNPTEKRSLIELVRAIRGRGVTVLLIEHDMGLVMELCERITVLDYGQKIAEGDAAAVRSDPRVIEAYLGPEAAVS